ncbi:ShlB/FhaC/HecB family hemolysin secretion/activation protein [Caballeronia humi]|uniref:ShlB/FhaC/HecB family hemolysin secretion/activation protein n=1 Tax=Caballeronia humi TaxID=326474 RepID=UPI0013580E48|nr:ShlB/FhaC/HecB family hemolysin secretion/activation protein [Caballeronia humi]
MRALPGGAQRLQEQQLNATQDAATARPTVLAPSASEPSAQLQFPLEVPCETIQEVEWRGSGEFAWLVAQTPLEGACIGPQGARVLHDWLARALIARGYVTSRVNVPEAGLKDGRIVVEIIPGRIGKVRDEGGIGWHRAAFPAGTGDLLNVRDLDQALENMRRLPGQSGVAFDVVPGANFGESDIVVQHPDSKRWHVVLSADNSGIDATGRNQLGAIVALDSPLHLYDQLIVSASTDAKLNDHTRGSQARSAAWNVPIGYASFSIGVSEWSSKQTLDAIGPDYPYESRTRRMEAGIGFAPYRSGDKKGTLQFKVVRRQDNATLGGAEIGVLKHDITGYDVSFSHQQALAHASVVAGAGVRGSFAGVSRSPGYVYGQTDWNGRYRIATMSASVDAPFSIGERSFAYRGSFLFQYSPTPVPSTEYLQIGGRYTVRGFDGDSTLSAESGWIWRNEVATGVAAGAEAYVALDAGRVHGTSAAQLSNHELVGTALGVRGAYRKVGYDVALGLPLVKPPSFGTRTPWLNVSLTSRF